MQQVHSSHRKRDTCILLQNLPLLLVRQLEQQRIQVGRASVHVCALLRGQACCPTASPAALQLPYRLRDCPAADQAALLPLPPRCTLLLAALHLPRLEIFYSLGVTYSLLVRSQQPLRSLYAPTSGQGAPSRSENGLQLL